jgi:hypothetical protein
MRTIALLLLLRTSLGRFSLHPLMHQFPLLVTCHESIARQAPLQMIRPELSRSASTNNQSGTRSPASQAFADSSSPLNTS